MTAHKTRLLVVDNDVGVIYSFRRVFSSSDFILLEALTGEKTLEITNAENPDVIVMDIHMPGQDVIAVMRDIRSIDPRIPVIFMTAYASTQSTLEALKAGAFDYVTKPFDIGRLRSVVRSAVKASRNMRQIVACESQDCKDAHAEIIICRSNPMKQVCRQIVTLAASDQPVLITGERGTGRQLAARAIYQHSRRKQKPFIALNCATILKAVLHDSLIGSHTMSPSGVQTGKPGRLEFCDGGIVLLNEISEMPFALQDQLITFLENGGIASTSGGSSVRVDVRPFATTSRNLGVLCASGEFRTGLHDRLCAGQIQLPPLRERRSDIPALAEYFIMRYCDELGLGKIMLCDDALNALTRYSFPGNVRELKHMIKGALVRIQGNRIKSSDLAIGSCSDDDDTTRNVLLPLADDSAFDALFDEIAKRQPLPGHYDAFDVIESRLVRRALEYCSGNQSHAARFLGITRNTLRKRIKKYGIDLGREINRAGAG
ncbi:MAG: sigma-54 dependent transcriptional regulator [bacterium]|nr:sigma-54 dependent transcriptional regulator [Candidatus Sumerlaeota bacterium]